MTKNSFRNKYFEKSSKELHANIFKSLEIKQYLIKVLRNQNFDVHECKINFSGSVLNIFLSIYDKSQQVDYVFSKRKKRIVTKIINTKKSNKNKFNKKELTNFNVFLTKKLQRTPSIKNLKKEIRYLKVQKLYKNYLVYLNNKSKQKQKDLRQSIINSLNTFNNNRFNINLTIKEINFTNFNQQSKQTLLNFRKFEKSIFFKKDGGTLILPIFTNKNSANLISYFISSQLKNVKQHKFFFNFLQETFSLLINRKFSKIEGIRTTIKGRINNAARSNKKIITIGRVPIKTINSKIDYSESIAFTSNGTIGVKVWVSEKI